MGYPSDLAEDEWSLIAADFNPTSKRGHSSKHTKKTIVKAIFYVLKGGITWRMMPNDLPPRGKPFMITLVNGTSSGSGKD